MDDKVARKLADNIDNLIDAKLTLLRSLLTPTLESDNEALREKIRSIKRQMIRDLT